MNLAEAFNQALPELPLHAVKRSGAPKVDPNLIVREQVEDGKRIMLVLVPEGRRYYPFTPDQWQLLRLFDGVRSYREIAELYSSETDTYFPESYVRQFAEQAQDLPFWYKTPQERNIALSEKLADERRHKLKIGAPFKDLTEITFSAWDPDAYLTKLHEKVKFLFKPWCVAVCLAAFVWSISMWLAHWGAISRDTIRYFDFTQKSLGGWAEFWTLMLIVGFIHESSHGLGCKHTGGEVHSMGFLLIYLSPAFFCDVTEAWVFGGRWQRVMTMSAGIWSELVLCFFATIVWLGTTPGSYVHQLSYAFILLAGIGAVLINLNPLIKLDGYYIFTEMIGVANLKENSTDFVTSWVKRNIFRLPVEVPHVRARRRLLYVPYALGSGAYGYLLFFFVVRFTYRSFYHFNPEWAFLPALLVALLIFRGRLRKLGRFLWTVYLDKKQRLQVLVRSARGAAFVAATAVLLFAPFWRQVVSGNFVLEPVQRSVIRATVPGFVEHVYAREGERVASGSTLARLRNVELEQATAHAAADAALAASRARQAQFQYQDVSKTEQERRRSQAELAALSGQLTKLSLISDLGGRIVTPRPMDRIGAYMKAGDEFAEVDDLSSLRALIYIPEYAIRDVHAGEQVKLLSRPGFAVTAAQVLSISPGFADTEPALVPRLIYEGIKAPHYFVVEALVANPTGEIRAGATGTAKVFIRRESIAAAIARTMNEFVRRKLW